MQTLQKYIADAEEKGRAIGHFNIAMLDVLWSVFRSAQEVSNQAGEQIPVIIGTSEGEREFMGVKQVVDLVKGLRQEYDYPIFINADHTYDINKALVAIDAGYDMVIYDGNKVSHEENLENTKRVVAYRNEQRADCIIEAELGNIGSGSDIKEALPVEVSEATMTDPEAARQFVAVTGIDALAPAVGNVHGMVRSGNPALDPDRVQAVRAAAGVPLVLHGGSGSTDEDFRKVVAAGISVVHISTELRVAYHEALKTTLVETNELAPYKFLASANQAVAKVIKQRIALFWGLI